MIDYFIHFINKSLHFFAGKDTSSINHRSDFADQPADFFHLHSRLLGDPVERTFIVRHFLHIYLNFSSQHFRKVGELLMNQIGMVILLIIKRAYQLGKFKGFVFRFLYDRYCPLPPPCCKHHKEQDSEHRQIDRPAKRPLRQKITQREIAASVQFPSYILRCGQ